MGRHFDLFVGESCILYKDENISNVQSSKILVINSNADLRIYFIKIRVKYTLTLILSYNLEMNKKDIKQMYFNRASFF